MKKTFSSIVLLLITSACLSQVKEPVSFTYSAKKINATTYELHITGSIEARWHTYSQTTPAGGPIPTKLSFTKNPLVTLIGKAKEVGKLEQHYEKLFGVDVKQFSDNIDFVQTIKLLKPIKTNISGSIEFMVCNDEECLPPSSYKFQIAIK